MAFGVDEGDGIGNALNELDELGHGAAQLLSGGPEVEPIAGDQIERLGQQGREVAVVLGADDAALRVDSRSPERAGDELVR